MKILLITLTFLVVTAHAAWSFYQDFPSVTGFYDHTAACSPMAAATN